MRGILRETRDLLSLRIFFSSNSMGFWRGEQGVANAPNGDVGD